MNLENGCVKDFQEKEEGISVAEGDRADEVRAEDNSKIMRMR